MSVPLAFAVPFANEPLGLTEANWIHAQLLMTGAKVPWTPRTGEFCCTLGIVRPTT
jgi:hypothetical protein